MRVKFGGAAREAELAHGRGKQTIALDRQGIELRAQPGFTHQDGYTVVHPDGFKPAGVERAGMLGNTPGRRITLEVRGTVLADLVHDFLVPGHLPRAVATGIEQVADVVPVSRGIVFLEVGSQLGCGAVDAHAFGGSLEMPVRNRRVGLRGIVFRRHQRLAAHQGREPGGHVVGWPVAQFPERVYRNKLVERPVGGDEFAGRVKVRQQVRSGIRCSRHVNPPLH